MNFKSTRNKETGPLNEVVLKGLAKDGGLYMPESIPVLSDRFIHSLPDLSLIEMATEVASIFLNETFSSTEIRDLVADTLTFPIPIIEIEPNIYSAELFHGPTMAFKDVGARFMARIMSSIKSDRKLKVIAATSGDTGSAVASGFHNIPGVEVYILYPQGKVSPLQEKQLTTWGDNITALEIQGTFDDCQHLAKQLLSDLELNEHFTLTSANSINIARLIPQSFYYFWAYSQLKSANKRMVISVPSGNFGNLTAGLMAQQMGLPVNHFIAATNFNKAFSSYIENGVFEPQPSVTTISNAMDVGNPSNLERMMTLFQNDVNQFKKHLSAYSFSDEDTRMAMRSVYSQNNYILDPHGAVGYLGLRKYMNSNTDVVGVFLETAHPAKFKEIVEKTLQINLEIPEKLAAFQRKKKKSIVMKPELLALKKLLVGEE
jgi:threonine synthase